jgi:hypothetical protein
MVVADFKYLPISVEKRGWAGNILPKTLKKYSAMGMSSRGFFVCKILI